MQLISIQLRNYRCHRDLKVQFHESRTVIGGLNESGKSTLVEAIHRALFAKATSNTADTRAMRPRGSDDKPEVTLEFRLGNDAYRLQKRFTHAANGTTMLVLPSGETLSGDAGDQKLLDLVGVQATGAAERLMAWGHLWGWQGKASDDPTKADTMQSAAGQLEKELAALSGTAALSSEVDDRVRTLVTAGYEATFTPKEKNYQSTSEVRRAERARIDAEQRVRATSLAWSEFHQAIDEGVAAEATIASCLKELAAINAELDTLGRSLAQVEELQQRRQREQAVLDAVQKQVADLESQDRRIRELEAERMRLEAVLEPARADLERAKATEQTCRQAAERARTIARQARQDEHTARTLAEVLRACETRAQLLGRRENLRDKVDQIERFRQSLKASETRLAALAVIDDEQLAAIEKLETELGNVGIRLDAIATRLQVQAAAAEVRLGEEPLQEGADQIILEPTELRVGAGTVLRITPGGGRSLDEIRMEQVRLDDELARALATVTCGSLPEARQLLTKRHATAREITEAAGKLHLLEVDEPKRLLVETETEIVRIEAAIERLTPPGREPSIGGEDLARAIEDAAAASLRASTALQLADESREEADRGLDAARARYEQCVVAVQENRTSLAQLEGQLSLLITQHGDRRSRSEALLGLQANRDLAQAAVDATTKAITALEPEALERRSQELNSICAQSTQTLRDAENRQNTVRGQLQEAGKVDLHREKAAAEATLEEASRTFRQLRLEAEAVKLLKTLVEDRWRALNEAYVGPLRERVEKYLDSLFGAGCNLGLTAERQSFRELSVMRPGFDGGRWQFEELSHGAREQVAAAFRLAMAEILAQRHGGRLPIVFDDAFANSDPERVKAIQRMLAVAASHGVQVIVVTCNPEEYATFARHRVLLPRPNPGPATS